MMVLPCPVSTVTVGRHWLPTANAFKHNDHSIEKTQDTYIKNEKPIHLNVTNDNSHVRRDPSRFLEKNGNIRDLPYFVLAYLH